MASELKVTNQGMRSASLAIVFSIIAAVTTIVFDWLFGRWVDYFFFSTLSNITPFFGPIWLAFPRIIIFVIAGFLFSKFLHTYILLGSIVYLIVVAIYFYKIRFGGGFWIANDPLAYFIAYLPFAVIPIAFAIGLFIRRRRR